MKATTDPWLIRRVDAMGHTVFLRKIEWVMEMPWSFWDDAEKAKRFDTWREARKEMRLLNPGAETIRLSDALGLKVCEGCGRQDEGIIGTTLGVLCDGCWEHRNEMDMDAHPNGWR